MREEKTITCLRYRVAYVFDISQTEGRELPPALTLHTLSGDVAWYADLFAALQQCSPVPIGFEAILGDAHGYYHSAERRIAIDQGMSELQNLKTLIHEIAHAKLHHREPNAPQGKDKRTREVEAESVAYVVCQQYGLDTSEYSFLYVALWSSARTLPELKGSLETIRRTAAEMIDGIDGYFAARDRAQSDPGFAA